MGLLEERVSEHLLYVHNFERSCGDGVVGYHAGLTHRRSRVRFSVLILKFFSSVLLQCVSFLSSFKPGANSGPVQRHRRCFRSVWCRCRCSLFFPAAFSFLVVHSPSTLPRAYFQNQQQVHTHPHVHMYRAPLRYHKKKKKKERIQRQKENKERHTHARSLFLLPSLPSPLVAGIRPLSSL